MGSAHIRTEAYLFNNPTINPDLVISFGKDREENRYRWRFINNSSKLPELGRCLINLDTASFYTDEADYIGSCVLTMLEQR